MKIFVSQHCKILIAGPSGFDINNRAENGMISITSVVIYRQI